MSSTFRQLPNKGIPELNALAPPKLKQRHLIQTRDYELGLDGVTILESDIIGSHKFKVRFETINDEPIEVKSSSKSAFWATIVFLVFALTSIANLAFEPDADTNAQASPYIWGFFAILTAFSFLLTRRQFIVYGSLNFYRDEKSRPDVLEFMDKVKSQRLDYFNKHLTLQMGRDTSVNDIARLVWLKDQGAITQEEFNKLKSGVIRRTEIGNSEPPPSKN
jgi:hypothetical protein